MQSEEKYRSLVENLPDVVWTVDQAGNIAFISPNKKNDLPNQPILNQIEKRGVHRYG